VEAGTVTRSAWALAPVRWCSAADHRGTRGAGPSTPHALVSGSAPGRRRLAILTNILAPYRVPIFERLADHFEVTVLFSGEEGNRAQWRGIQDEVHRIRVKRAKGFTFAWNRRERGAVLDTRYLHVNPGLITELLRIRPDAILTDEMGFRTLTGLLYARLFAKPAWVWWGGTVHTECGIALGKRLFRRWLVGRVHRWFSYGITSTDYLVSLGVPPQKVVELQNCIPEEAYLNAQSPSIQFEIRPVLLCVGQLIPRKGVDLLLEAAARVQAEGLSFSLLVVGDGPEKPLLEQRAKELMLRDVHFHAPQPPTRMPAVYRSGDVLVFPTREDVWGLVVNEALWSGLPALVSIYAGCARELVPPGSTFDPLDPTDFAAKLRLAVAGQLPPPDLTRVKRIDEVSGIIIRELNATLRDAGEDPSRP
jgi:glycosyltransferase involved in cell wall biosynthesis